MFNYFEDIPRAIKVVLSKSKLVAVEDVAYSMRAEKKGKRVKSKASQLEK